MHSKITSLIALVFIIFSSSAQVTEVVVEEVDNGGKVPGNTYRIYLQCTSKDDRVTGVFAFEDNDMYIRSTKPFFQSAYGGPLANNIIRATLREKPELRYDSWFTIGYEDNYQNAVSGFNLDFEAFENGEGLATNDGAWYVTPDKVQTKPNQDLRVLVAQLTSEGIITGKFSVIGRTVTGSDTWDNWQIKDLTFSAGEK